MPVVNRHKFRKREWIYMNLVSSASKLCYNICRQETRVTSCHINIGILYFKITIKHILKFWHMLDLIKKYIIHLVVYHFRINI